jgi:hypothetical protein
MNLDNTTLTVGMSVYDLAFGYGRVLSVASGIGAEVLFDAGYTKSYASTGVGPFPARTLYLENPSILPPFGDDRDQLFGDIVRSIHALFSAGNER